MQYHPGQLAQVSGQYAVIDTLGRNTGYEVTVVRGEPFPPTSAPGYTFVLVDATKHRR
ncbi:MAG: hypothetical protein RMZ42_28190 [Nostoc sp. DedQUE05]|uniref:hypothetical protein n=1 Tax=Nostoc sp. DedQUE05 TaxID=3075391 RepID=UPI002AD22B6D|nr:hypothetical protein [Nostoc sp. DedQUE05]MDZ8095793.1 hypothetical protein [Nostoc sp. DedQUE05]